MNWGKGERVEGLEWGEGVYGNSLGRWIEATGRAYVGLLRILYKLCPLKTDC